MLKTIAREFTPGLLHTLAVMGHGDWLAIVDANYPAYSLHDRVLPLPGLDAVQAGALVTSLLPIDDFVAPAGYWMCPDGEPDEAYEVHRLFRARVEEAEGREVAFAALERSAFYRKACKAFAVAATSDTRPYACFLIAKGIVRSG